MEEDAPHLNSFSSLHEEILSILSPSSATSMDELIQQTGKDDINVSSTLSELELDGAVQRLVGGFIKS